MLKTKSIIFSARLVGGIAGFLLIISIFLAVNFSVYVDKMNEVHRAVQLYDLLFTMHNHKENFETYILKHHLTPIARKTMEDVRLKGKPLIEDKTLRETLQSGSIEIFIYKEHYYYTYKMDMIYYYRSDEKVTPYKLYITIVALILLILLILLYRYIAVTVYDTQALERSRSLFMRNLMHELKTPISKGKLLLHFLEGKTKDKVLLETLFDQMEGHLSDLAKVEAMTSQSMVLEKKPYAIIDIIDHAFDLLEIDEEEIVLEIENKTVEVDFTLFSYAIKNLVDNALKYTQEKPIKIEVKENKFTILNRGKPFTQKIETYFKPYQRDTTQHSLEGMGLGLYIVKEIVLKHQYKLDYRYENGYHCFSISF